MSTSITTVTPDDRVTAIIVPVPRETGPVTSIEVLVPAKVTVVAVIPGSQPVKEVSLHLIIQKFICIAT